jgi:hypothetical protein
VDSGWWKSGEGDQEARVAVEKAVDDRGSGRREKSILPLDLISTPKRRAVGVAERG